MNRQREKKTNQLAGIKNGHPVQLIPFFEEKLLKTEVVANNKETQLSLSREN